MALASRSKRSRRSGLAADSSERILMATVRLSRPSFARYTSPMPPAPSGETISYGPRRGARGQTHLALFSPPAQFNTMVIGTDTGSRLFTATRKRLPL